MKLPQCPDYFPQSSFKRVHAALNIYPKVTNSTVERQTLIADPENYIHWGTGMIEARKDYSIEIRKITPSKRLAEIWIL